MRLLIASGVLVFGVALLAALSPSAAAASAAHSQPSIVCPQVANPPMCCPVPVAGVRAEVIPCCATVPCPTPGLTIGASANPVSEGSHVTISGTLSGGTAASQDVDLYEKLAGQAAFSDVASTQTDAAGAYSFVRAVQTNAEWYAKAGTVQSAGTIAELVLAAVALHPSSVRPKAGAQILLSGTIAPSHAGERVELQRLRHGQWMTIARPKLNAESRFVIAEKMRKHASARFRVVLAADARNALSVSSVVAITTR